MTFVDFPALERFLADACGRYERSAPTVRDYCDDLYRRLQDSPATVSLAELTGVGLLCVDGSWLAPNGAANAVLHLRDRLGMATDGMIDF